MRTRGFSAAFLRAVIAALAISVAWSFAGASTVRADGVSSLSLTTSSYTPAIYDVGQAIDYEFLVTNTGDTTLTGVTVLSDKFGGVRCPTTLLSPGVAMTCVGTYTVTQADTDAGSITVVGSVSGVDPDGDEIEADLSPITITVVQQSPDLSLTVSTTTTSLLSVGQVVSYNFVVTNDGNETLTDPTVGDSTVANVSCPVIPLEPGAFIDCDGSYTVTQSDLDAGRLTDRATAIASASSGSNVVSPSAGVTISAVQSPGLSLSSSTTTSSVSSVGDTANYSFVVKNTGNVTLSSTAVTDELGELVICPSTTLAPGASTSCSGSYAVTQSDLDAGSVTDSAVASASTLTGTSVESLTSGVTVSAVQSPGLSLSSSTTTSSVSSVGQLVHYSFVVTNTGNVVMNDVSVDDSQATPASELTSQPVCVDLTSPASACSGMTTDLAPGQIATFSAEYDTTLADLQNGSIDSSAVALGNSAVGSAVTSAPSSLTVAAQIPTSISLALLPPSIVYGQSASATATVTAGIPGVVQFTVDGTDLGSPVAVNNAAASSPAIGALTPGPHALAASFTPTASATYSPSNANAQTLTVGQAPTLTHLIASGGQLAAAVSVSAPGSGIPTGPVTFTAAGSVIGTVELTHGTATLTYRVPNGQKQAIKATYDGNDDFLGSSGSTSSSGAPVVDPKMTTKLTSAVAKTKYGWYRSPVKVSFICRAGSAPLAGSCPRPVVISKDVATQAVTRTIHATDGGVATASVANIKVDRQRPELKVGGVKPKRVYGGSSPKLTCEATDEVSGVATCRIKTRTATTSTGLMISNVHYTATAEDKAGNTTTKRGEYSRLGIYLRGASFRSGAFSVHAGSSYTIVVADANSRPQYAYAAAFPLSPSKPGPEFRSLGDHRWALTVGLPVNFFHEVSRWDLGVRIGATVHEIRVVNG